MTRQTPKWGRRYQVTPGPDPYAGTAYTRRFGPVTVFLDTTICDICRVRIGRRVFFISESIHPWIHRLVVKPLIDHVEGQWAYWEEAEYYCRMDAATDEEVAARERLAGWDPRP